MKERFEKRKLYGKINVGCRYDDGSVRNWITSKEQVVDNIVKIVDRYEQMGYRLTLRQLHYQFVANVPGYINHTSAYKKLGTILDDCRYGGVIDWDSIEDRGRVPYLPYYAANIPDALEDIYNSYRLDRQRGQDTLVEVWTEKDALSAIMKRSTSKYHVRLVVNKGYSSSSAMYEAYQRFSNAIQNGKNVVVLYFGDHDPSGLDMVRDIQDRIEFMLENGEDRLLDMGDNFTVKPIGLTMQQIKQYRLPPNPTKLTDTRSAGYIAQFGTTCWEVDALPPERLTEIVESHIEAAIDLQQYETMLRLERFDREKLKAIIDAER